jgi:hypothetical protein
MTYRRYVEREEGEKERWGIGKDRRMKGRIQDRKERLKCFIDKSKL